MQETFPFRQAMSMVLTSRGKIGKQKTDRFFLRAGRSCTETSKNPTGFLEMPIYFLFFLICSMAYSKAFS